MGIDVLASVVHEVVHRPLGVLRHLDLVRLRPHLDADQRDVDVERCVEMKVKVKNKTVSSSNDNICSLALLS